MTALPKRKLCWNCEGNISRELDNCPYCGVYVHSADFEGSSYWNPSYTPQESLESVPPPLYSVQESVSEESLHVSNDNSLFWSDLFLILKQEVFPVLFLMSGSVFFLFGLILFLFARDGTLTLRWDGSLWSMFALLSVPSLWMGWSLLHRLEEDSPTPSSSKVVAKLSDSHSFHDE